MKIKNLVSGLLVMIFLAVAVFQSCKKDKKYDPIPYVYVNIYLNPNSTQYINLNVIGGHEYLLADPPSKGIIVYRLSQDEFLAYERMCPYDPNNTCAGILVEPSGSTAIDSCCMSRYILLDGSPFSGPSTLSMKQYRTYYDGNLLHIYN